MNQYREFHHVAIYLGISREKNENVDTPDNYKQQLIEFAKSKSYTYEIYGEVISGGSSELEQRLELQKLLDNIEKFDAILCVEISRLSRNRLISQTVKQHRIDYDKPIIMPYQTYDLGNSSNDWLVFDFGSVIASQEHALIGKRVRLIKFKWQKQAFI
ncbi:recombinase family protein [Priestia megaterium]|uniref:recombinase family protein n=1 Tax=Priestia megaterium TaxID=1404 RepID=UPI00203F19B3|nr:recombinase family protein [Priestia megaterium]MCM3016906.1 recombinase family protein [Priestia megaterium]